MSTPVVPRLCLPERSSELPTSQGPLRRLGGAGSERGCHLPCPGTRGTGPAVPHPIRRHRPHTSWCLFVVVWGESGGASFRLGSPSVSVSPSASDKSPRQTLGGTGEASLVGPCPYLRSSENPASTGCSHTPLGRGSVGSTVDVTGFWK